MVLLGPISCHSQHNHWVFFRWQVLGHVPRKMLEPRIPIDSCRKGLLEGKQLELHLIFGHTQSTRPAAGLLKRCSSTCSAVWRSEGDPWRNSRGSCGVLPVFLTCVRMLRFFFWNIAASESTRFWPLADKKSSRGKANFHLTKDTKAETCRFWKMADSSKMAWPDQPPRLQQWDGCHPETMPPGAVQVGLPADKPLDFLMSWVPKQADVTLNHHESPWITYFLIQAGNLCPNNGVRWMYTNIQLRQGEGPAEEHRPLAGEGATSISSKLIPFGGFLCHGVPH